MKKHGVRIILIGLALLLLLAFAPASLADAGSFSGDTDWGGGSDWGSSDWGSSDWGSSDWGSSSSSDWGSGSSSGWGSTIWDTSSDDDDYYDDGDGDDGIGLLPIIVAIIIVVVVIRSMKKNKGSANAQQMYTATEDNTPGLPIEQLLAKDPNFNRQALCEQIGNKYMQMQDAWEKKDWEPMRAIMTDSLFNQMGRQLDELKQRGLTNYVEKIAVLDASIRKYLVEGDNDVLIVRLKTRICDYTVNDKTGKVVSGNQTRELFMTYDWKMIRQKDRKTLTEDEMSSVSCPNCGAPLSIKHTGKCDYCGTVVTISDHDWVLSSIKGISQRSS